MTYYCDWCEDFPGTLSGKVHGENALLCEGCAGPSGDDFAHPVWPCPPCDAFELECRAAGMAPDPAYDHLTVTP
jgi:hypothetical protein